MCSLHPIILCTVIVENKSAFFGFLFGQFLRPILQRKIYERQIKLTNSDFSNPENAVSAKFSSQRNEFEVIVNVNVCHFWLQSECNFPLMFLCLYGNMFLCFYVPMKTCFKNFSYWPSAFRCFDGC